MRKRLSEDAKDIINSIRSYIEKSDKILLAFTDKSFIEGLVNYYNESALLGGISKKILVLGEGDISCGEYCNFKYIRISGSERDSIAALYRTYEFSDRVLLISEDSRYGSLFNYVNTGLLTREELYQILLG